jgi:formamidopyrimidine-DNA glycosylase
VPELPEVEALSRSFDATLRGRVVAAVTIRSIAVLKTHTPPPAALIGHSVAGCGRHGKFIDISLPPYHLVFHLARAGWLRWKQQPTQARAAMRGPLAFVLTFRDGSTLEATEQGTEKRLAVYIVEHVADVPGIARLGIDALDGALEPARLSALLREQHGTLKNVLADQAVIAGIGNAYSDEILHAARLSPFRPARALDDAEVARLHAAMRGVLAEAVTRVATLESSALKADKRAHMRVHGRSGLPCQVCGDTIREVSLANRSFQYCPTCQTGGRVYADRRMSRLLR